MNQIRKKRVRQFTGTSQKRQFFDRRIIRFGPNKWGATLAVGKIMPKNWLYVRLWKPIIQDDKMWLLIECLLKEKEVK